MRSCLRLQETFSKPSIFEQRQQLQTFQSSRATLPVSRKAPAARCLAPMACVIDCQG